VAAYIERVFLASFLRCYRMLSMCFCGIRDERLVEVPARATIVHAMTLKEFVPWSNHCEVTMI